MAEGLVGWKAGILGSMGPEFGEVRCVVVRGIQEGVVMGSRCVFRAGFGSGMKGGILEVRVRLGSEKRAILDGVRALVSVGRSGREFRFCGWRIGRKLALSRAGECKGGSSFLGESPGSFSDRRALAS